MKLPSMARKITKSIKLVTMFKHSRIFCSQSFFLLTNTIEDLLDCLKRFHKLSLQNFMTFNGVQLEQSQERANFQLI